MPLNELGPDRGPIPEMTDLPAVTLIGAAADEAVPQGVLLADAPLPSLDADEVRDWLAQHVDRTIFVVAGQELATEGTPSLSVYVTEAEYKAVTSGMPR
jgi:hypothetical protein